MSLSVAISIFISLSCYSPICCNAFNITKILEEYPDFTTFNDLLNQTKLVANINSRRTITVLAVDNGAMSGLSGMSLNEQRNVLSVHVVLDYYDNEKFSKMKRKWRILTTLFQTTGKANGKQGFLNVSKSENGIIFRSAVPDAGVTANLVGSVASQPYNLSVLQVSNVIIPPDMSTENDDSSNSTSPSKAPSPKKATAPSPDSDAETPETAASPPEPDEDYDYSDSPSDAPAPAPTGKTSSSSRGETCFAVSAGLSMVVTVMWCMVAIGAL